MITISLQNTDLDDLFIWVSDKNQLGSPAVVDGSRLNKGDSLDVEVQEDGEGKGLIRWRVERADPEDKKSAEEDDLEVHDGEQIDVSAF